MSATNRGAIRREADYYPTPAWCTRALLRAVPGVFDRGDVVDPFAGDGAILRVVREAGATPWAVELRRECWADLVQVCGHGAVIIGDALRLHRADVEDAVRLNVVTNPPYSLAQEAVESWVGTTPAAFLLRLGFLGGQRRAAWWQKWQPAQIHVMPRRPSFTGAGTDATEYAWFVWHVEPKPLAVMPLDWCV